MSWLNRYFSNVIRPDPYDRNNKITVTEFNSLKFFGELLIVVVTLILLAIVWPFNSVPTGTRGVITQFGKIISIEDEGLVVLWPWQKLAIFNIRAEEAKVENADGGTSDLQQVRVSMTVRYSIMTNKVAEVYEKYSHDGDLSSYVQSGTQEVFKAVTAKYTAPDLVLKRQEVSTAINTALSTKFEKYGAQVINIDMRNFTFSTAYQNAINDKTTQEQLRLVAENKLKTVESENKQQVVVAEATAAAVKAQADGDAYATLKNAQASAESLRIQNAALAQNRDVLELRKIEVAMKQAEAGLRWNGQLPTTMYGSAPVPFININGGKF